MSLTEKSRRVLRRNIRGIYGERVFTGPCSTVDADVLSTLPLHSLWPSDSVSSGAITVTGVYEPTVTGTATGVYGTVTTITATTAMFVPAQVGATITITDVGAYTVASWVSSTVITIAGDHAFSAKGISLPLSGQTRLTASSSIFTAAMAYWLMTITDVTGIWRVATYNGVTSIDVYGDAHCTTKTFTIYNWFGSYLHETYIDYRWDGTVSKVLATYEPPTVARALENNPGKGILKVRFIEEAEHRLKDLSGQRIQGEFLYENYWHRMVPAVGTPVIVTARPTMLILTVALTSLPVDLIESLIGTTNSNVLPAFGSWGAPGTLLFHSPDADQVYRDQTLYKVEFRLEHTSIGWNTGAVKMQEQIQDAQDILGKDQAGNPKTTPTTTLGWRDTGSPFTAVMAATADWSALNAYLS